MPAQKHLGLSQSIQCVVMSHFRLVHGCGLFSEVYFMYIFWKLKDLNPSTFFFCIEVAQCTVSQALLSGLEYTAPDSAFSASTAFDSYFCPACSRLNDAFGWSPSNSVAGEWVQANLGDLFMINAIQTRGTGYNSAQEFVSAYKLASSTNGVTWTIIEDEAGNDIMFDGNTDADTVVTNELPETITTRYVRLTIVSFVYWPVLRWEVRGCPAPWIFPSLKRLFRIRTWLKINVWNFKIFWFLFQYIACFSLWKHVCT